MRFPRTCGPGIKNFLTSRRNNKIATQVETADLVSALSEATGSSSSSAPVHAMRGASAALLAKEIIPNGCDQQLKVGIPLLFPGGVAINSASQQQSTFVGPPSNQLEVSQIVPETMLPSNVAVKYSASEYGVFFAAHVTLFLL